MTKRWVEDSVGERRIGRTLVCEEPEVWVSTVFLGPVEWLKDLSPYAIFPDGLFELMVFVDGKGMDNLVFRYSTMGEAKEGHLKLCETMYKTFHGIPVPNCS